MSLRRDGLPALPGRSTDDAVDPASAPQPPDPSRSTYPSKNGLRTIFGLGQVARRTLGICFLLTTVFMWTGSNFIASFMFADHTYDKPFFVVYINTSVFAISLIPMFSKYLYRSGMRGLRRDLTELWHEHKRHGMTVNGTTAQETYRDMESDGVGPGDALLQNDDQLRAAPTLPPGHPSERLNFRETALLSLEFCMLWFVANYFAGACFEHTSVASGTILASTSSVWTLIFCAVMRVDAFTLRKLAGVLASLLGIAITFTIDLTGGADEDRGSFPEKTTAQLAIGDAMAFTSAVVYGIYVTVMKKRVGNEERVDMKVFFGLVGVFNLLFLWPLFFIFHWTGLETFELPSGRIWTIIIINALMSFVGDVAWAFAMLLTTPLLVTIGLSLTIPLSLIGEMVQYGQYSTFTYWIGASIVFLSFLFINHESKTEDELGTDREPEP